MKYARNDRGEDGLIRIVEIVEGPLPPLAPGIRNLYYQVDDTAKPGDIVNS